MKVNRSEFLKALEAVKPGLANKEVIQQTTSFHFSAGYITTYNDEVAVSIPFDLEGLIGVVSSTELVSLLKKVKDPEVEISVKDAELIVSGAKFTAGIVMQAESTLPVCPVPSDGWAGIPEGLITALKACLVSVSPDMSRPELSCMHTYKNFIESSDNFRITRHTISEELPELLVPGKAVKQLVTYPIIEYVGVDGWLHCRTTEGCVFSCRTVEADFPDVTPVLDAEEGVVLKFPEDISGILERALSVLTEAGTEEKVVKVGLKAGKLVVKAQGRVARFEESARVRGKETLEFEINAPFLLDFLKISDSAVVAGEGRMLKFSGENFVHVIALSAGE